MRGTKARAAKRGGRCATPWVKRGLPSSTAPPSGKPWPGSKGRGPLIEEYGKAIAFDYSYRYFYGDGYGKDFTILNLQQENDGRN